MKTYTVEINLTDGSKVIEQFTATSAVSAHHKAFAKYKRKITATVIIAE